MTKFVSQVRLASCFPIFTSTMVSARCLIIVFLYLFLTFSVASAARSPAFYCLSCVVAVSFQWFAVYSFPRFFLAFKFVYMLYFRACGFYLLPCFLQSVLLVLPPFRDMLYFPRALSLTFGYTFPDPSMKTTCFTASFQHIF